MLSSSLQTWPDHFLRMNARALFNSMHYILKTRVPKSYLNAFKRHPHRSQGMSMGAPHVHLHLFSQCSTVSHEKVLRFFVDFYIERISSSLVEFSFVFLAVSSRGISEENHIFLISTTCWIIDACRFLSMVKNKFSVFIIVQTRYLFPGFYRAKHSEKVLLVIFENQSWHQNFQIAFSCKIESPSFGVSSTCKVKHYNATSWSTIVFLFRCWALTRNRIAIVWAAIINPQTPKTRQLQYHKCTS